MMDVSGTNFLRFKAVQNMANMDKNKGIQPLGRRVAIVVVALIP
eukprot:CAMPEP_0178923506 /NCGR_PEP_ID=MMETSP0786-20121207/16755_1 /TAXON_ID=186022 /ORGANISM="Thalassionema frauenfeldii, Strain CCMP 1798" /LENGTH=43 /DNA_ID= /DNA_START= /DNA_END= /DNA_ORIENTATION=